MKRNGTQLPEAHSCVLAGWNRFQQTPLLSWHFFDSFLAQVPCLLCTELDLPILCGDPALLNAPKVELGVEQLQYWSPRQGATTGREPVGPQVRLWPSGRTLHTLHSKILETTGVHS